MPINTQLKMQNFVIHFYNSLTVLVLGYSNVRIVIPLLKFRPPEYMNFKIGTKILVTWSVRVNVLNIHKPYSSDKFSF